MKVLISLLAVLLVIILLAMGGLYLYRNYAQPATTEATDGGPTLEDNGKGPLGRIGKPVSPLEIPNNLTYAMEKSLDAVGWLEVPGTDINNVVMQGNDNVYYERRNEDGEDDIYGCYFMDVECSLGTEQDFLPNTIIYGHSDLTDSPDGPRFSQLFRFTDPVFAKEHPYMYVSTLDGRYQFEIFSVFYTDTSFDYIRVHMTDEQTLALAEKAQSLSAVPYETKPVLGDKLLTLSTCSVRDGNDGTHRFVVVGRYLGYEPFDAPSTELSSEIGEEMPSEPENSEKIPEETVSQDTESTASQATSSETTESSAIESSSSGVMQPVIPNIPPIQPIIPNTPTLPQQPVTPVLPGS